MSIKASPTPGVLRRLRRAAGLSQQQVATRAGCSIAAVALYERGYTPERSDVLPRIVRVLNDDAPATNERVGKEAAGRALWTAIVGDLPPSWELDERELAVLALACRQQDDIARLEVVLKRDGAVVPGSTGQPRLSAALAELRQARLACSKLLGDLHLPDEDGKAASASSQRAARAAHSRWDRVQARKAAPRGAA